LNLKNYIFNILFELNIKNYFIQKSKNKINMKNGQKEQLNLEKTPIENNIEKDILRTSINTFQKMKDLQSLIKKESAIKELCKKIF
jgi:hypothetical protein